MERRVGSEIGLHLGSFRTLGEPVAQAEIATDFQHDLLLHRLPSQGQAVEERVVTDDANRPRDSPRMLVDSHHGLPREEPDG